MLEKLSPQLRHALIALLGSVLTISMTYVHSIHLSKPVEALIGSLLASLALVLTPLTNQYGITVIKDAVTPDNK
jgi:hypothetical protein